ncbi:small ribosomal subunit biogenesis GTPase RsgA [Arenicella sp. 4NH20-0111]
MPTRISVEKTYAKPKISTNKLMSNRKLNRRQAWRAERIQQERNERALKKERNLTRQVQSGDLSSEQQGLVICRYSKHFEIEALEGEDQGSIHICVSRTNLGNIVAGDHVIWRAGADQTGVIESKLNRKSLLERPDNFGRLKAVAANIDQMIIVISPEPSPQPNLIDRYLVAAELMHIRPVLVLNKADLLDEYNEELISELLNVYHSLGYQTSLVISSRHQEPHLNNLPSLINGRTSIVVGQSGVGKSSLINTLLPEAKLAVGDLSSATGEGTHTTTQAKLFHLPTGGQLIDSPGIRDFSLWHIDVEQLQLGFIEIAQQLGHCKFRDCKHEQEPGCAIQAAVDDGAIDEVRFDSYERIKAAILEQQARGLTSP